MFAFRGRDASHSLVKILHYLAFWKRVGEVGKGEGGSGKRRGGKKNCLDKIHLVFCHVREAPSKIMIIHLRSYVISSLLVC